MLVSPSRINRALEAQIQVILGPMFSGKTTELLRRIRRFTIANKKCVVIKYNKDNRYSQDCMSTHDKYVLCYHYTVLLFLCLAQLFIHIFLGKCGLPSHVRNCLIQRRSAGNMMLLESMRVNSYVASFLFVIFNIYFCYFALIFFFLVSRPCRIQRENGQCWKDSDCGSFRWY